MDICIGKHFTGVAKSLFTTRLNEQKVAICRNRKKLTSLSIFFLCYRLKFADKYFVNTVIDSENNVTYLDKATLCLMRLLQIDKLHSSSSLEV